MPHRARGRDDSTGPRAPPPNRGEHRSGTYSLSGGESEGGAPSSVSPPHFPQNGRERTDQEHCPSLTAGEGWVVLGKQKELQQMRALLLLPPLPASQVALWFSWPSVQLQRERRPMRTTRPKARERTKQLIENYTEDGSSSPSFELGRETRKRALLPPNRIPGLKSPKDPV